MHRNGRFGLKATTGSYKPSSSPSRMWWRHQGFQKTNSYRKVVSIVIVLSAVFIKEVSLMEVTSYLIQVKSKLL